MKEVQIMAAKKTKEPKKRTKTFYEGERFSLFFTKGDRTNRVRLFPSADGYKVSVNRTEDGKPGVRAVQAFESLQEAKDHVDVIREDAEAKGWDVKVGVLSDNVSLFED